MLTRRITTMAALAGGLLAAAPAAAQAPAEADSFVATPPPTPRRPVGMAPT